MYYGLLRQEEVHTITTCNVKLDSKKKIVRVNFEKQTKIRSQDFKYEIPSHLYSVFEAYVREIKPSKNLNKFLNNW